MSEVIEDRIEADERLRNADIEARTDDGVVYLSGRASSHAERILAEQHAASTAGIVAVVSDIRIATEEEDDPPMTPIYDDGVSEYEDSSEHMMDPSN